MPIASMVKFPFVVPKLSHFDLPPIPSQGGRNDSPFPFSSVDLSQYKDNDTIISFMNPAIDVTSTPMPSINTGIMYKAVSSVVIKYKLFGDVTWRSITIDITYEERKCNHTFEGTPDGVSIVETMGALNDWIGDGTKYKQVTNRPFVYEEIGN